MFGYHFRTINEILRTLDTQAILEVIGADFFEKILITMRNEGWDSRALLILERWTLTENNSNRIAYLMSGSEGRRRKLIYELQMQARLEQGFLELPENIEQLKNGLAEHEVFSQAPFSFDLPIR